jgi:hypothetical protein
MIKFHAPSFVAGAVAAVVFMKARGRLHPVAVELGSLGVHLGRLARSLAERQIEDLEDLWAEMEERLRERARAASQKVAEGAPAGPTNGVARAA